jgi:hypothetical protein
MIGVILGFALGAMSFTATGREVGNKIADLAINEGKKMLAKPESEPKDEESAD